jgi:hypothetical protein
VRGARVVCWLLGGMELTQLAQGCDKVLAKIIDGLEPTKVSQGPCGKRIAKSQHAYKCLDCGADPTCVMCVECFKRSPCVDHNFRLVKSGGGRCVPEMHQVSAHCAHARRLVFSHYISFSFAQIIPFLEAFATAPCHRQFQACPSRRRGVV